MKQTVYLQFLPEYDAYGISDEKKKSPNYEHKTSYR